MRNNFAEDYETRLSLLSNGRQNRYKKCTRKRKLKAKLRKFRRAIIPASTRTIRGN